MMRLGEGRAAPPGMGPKAALLDRAARAGLMVPEGYVVGGQETPAEPPAGQWAVRSAFSEEDGGRQSLAGWFETRLRVPAAGVPEAVAEVRASAARRAGEFRRDVLVMRMVEARHAGVAFTEADYEDDLVNYTAGTAEGLVSGAIAGERLLLEKLGPFEPARGPAGWPRRLQRLLREVRRVFGAGDWDVEWADDGRRCWLIQVRRITAAPRRDEAFTLANHREILPPLPSVLMSSVITNAAPALFGYYREFDPTLPAGRLFIEEFAGRPLINISLMTEMMRHWGLPTSLVTGNIGGVTDREAPLRPWRLLRRLPVLVRVAWAQVRAPGAAREAVQALRRRPAGENFTEALAQLGEAYVALVRGMFGLTGAMSGPLAALRRLGVLNVWAARHETVTTRMARELRSLAREEWLARYGHRGVYESDIARPRYAEAPPPRPGERESGEPARPRLCWRARLAAPLWWQAARPLAAREWFRDEMMREFARIRGRLMELCTRAGVAPETLWLMSVEEARRLDTGWRPDANFVAEREAVRARQAAIRLPELVRRQDDLEAVSERGAACTGAQIRGISLTAGRISGRVLVLTEPAAALPAGYAPESTVLVAGAVDAGWIPLFQQVAGVVVETGGDLSHGSILLRELGLPAITNAAGATVALANGDRVELNAAAGTVRVVEARLVQGEGVVADKGG